MIHQLKTWPIYFKEILSGTKSFEVRKNDREFSVGDFLALNEFAEGKHTGRCCMVEVVYILDDISFVKDGFVILGIRPCCIGSRSNDLLRGAESVYKTPVYGDVERERG